MNKALKFCMITTFYPPYSFGGDAMHVYRLSNELARQGDCVDVFHCEDAYNLLKEKTAAGEFPNHPNVNVIRLKSRAGFLSPLLTQQTGAALFKRKIKNALENNQYDVIHYHNISLIGITALSYGSAAAVKLYTTHEHWLICPMHALWKFDREVCVKKACTACQLFGKRPPQLWRHTQMLEENLKYLDCLISPSRFTLNKHLADGLKISAEVIPNFVPMQSPPEMFNSVKIREDPYFLFVGRLEKIKGVQNLIPVFRANQDYNLLIAGTGEYKTELEKLAQDLPNIEFLGNLSQKELGNYYRQASGVIVPSVCYETFGMVIIEAFALKTPVLVNNLGALPEPVRESGGGFIYNNDAELTEAIKILAANKELRDELGNKGYQGFIRFWNENAHLSRYLDLIERIRSSRI